MVRLRHSARFRFRVRGMFDEQGWQGWVRSISNLVVIWV